MTARAAFVFTTLVVTLVTTADRARAQDASETENADLPVTVVLGGASLDAVRAALAHPGDLPVQTRFVPLPDPAPVAAPLVPSAIADARTAYVNADFAACLGALGDDASVHVLLARGEVEIASRILFWRVACHVGAGDADGAHRAAARFSQFGLTVPADVEAASPEVEAALADALSAASSAPRAPLRVRADPPADVSVDGRASTCETPCAVDLGPGDHVIALRAPGRVDAWRLVRMEGRPLALRVELDEASPELAGQQWAERWATREDRDSTSSVRLLAQAVRARRLVYLRIEPTPNGDHLRGVLAMDGEVTARAERDGARLGEASLDLFRELLVQGGAIELGEDFWESPWFWIGLGAAAAIAVAITTAVLFTPTTTTNVGFRSP